MKVYNINDLQPGNKPYDDLFNSVKHQRLVPIIGSGFTSGTITRNGIIPSVDQLKKEIVKILFEFDEDYSDASTKSDWEKLSLSDLSVLLLNSIANHPAEMKNAFLSYMESNFFYIRDLPSEKQEFLNCGWPYIYTLNYDTFVEQSLPNYEVIIPYSSINRDWMEKRPCVIKLHGDIHRLMQTGDIEKYCILTQNQYLNSMQSEENRDLQNWLKDDFSSKDILFIGCGLSDELDLLFASGNVTPEKIHGLNTKTSYYLYYDTTGSSIFSPQDRAKFAKYGIENVIRISPEEMNDFYSIIINIFNSSTELNNADELIRYTNYTFSQLSASAIISGYNKNIPYLFNNAYLNPSDNQIVLPSFFVEREYTNHILSSINEDYSIYIVHGNRFSGKTYILLDLVKKLQLQRKDTYFFFNVHLADQALELLLEKKGCYLIFDTDTVNYVQFKHFFQENSAQLKANQIVVIYTINHADRDFASEWDDLTSGVDSNICILKKVSLLFNTNELNSFNQNIGLLSIAERKKGETFLDYAIKIDEQQLVSSNGILPRVDILSSQNLNLLMAVIALAACENIDNSLANMLDIQGELATLCEIASQAVQRDYLSNIEREISTHSGVKFVSNSTYWLYRTLSKFAVAKSHYQTISNAMYRIVKNYISHSVKSNIIYDKKKYSKLKDYYYLETIQRMFFCDSPYRGSLDLPEKIYTTLSPLMSNDYQFLHQTCKCKLRQSRKITDNTTLRNTTLSAANSTLQRAIQLVQNSPSSNSEYTLAHMYVTKALILTNCLRYCRDVISIEKQQSILFNAIDAYYHIYIDKRAFVDDPSEGHNSDERNDVKWFMNQFTDIELSNSLRDLVEDTNHQREMNEIINAWNQRIYLDWRL